MFGQESFIQWTNQLLIEPFSKTDVSKKKMTHEKNLLIYGISDF